VVGERATFAAALPWLRSLRSCRGRLGERLSTRIAGPARAIPGPADSVEAGIESQNLNRNGPKIKELSRELGVTSRQIVDRCRAEGIPVQNSVTRLDELTADRVRGWFRPVLREHEPLDGSA